MKFNNTYICVMPVFIALITVLAYGCIAPPVYDPSKSPYPAEAALSDLKAAAAKPHSSLDQEALGEVREFLLRRFDEMGIEATVNTYNADNWLGQYQVNNIAAQIDGQDDAPNVLIMAHYDSVTENLDMKPTKSTGAADDGYGVSTLLQIAEHFSKSNEPLTNGIKFMLTDSEETGPGEGSKAEIEQNKEFYSDVSLIINIEGRSFNGPVMMIQTNKGNSRVVELYKKANSPLSSSVISDMFSFMPNFTDLQPFLEAGYPGLNFSTVGHMKYYHSDNDNLDNVKIDTLNHYLEQIMPIVTEFVSNSKYSDADYFRALDDSNYFTVFSRFLFSYNSTWNVILIILSFACLLAFIFTGSKKFGLSKKLCLVSMVKWLIYALVSVTAGAVTVVLISLLFGIPLNPMYMWAFELDAPVFILFAALMLGCSVLMVIRQVRKSGALTESLVGGIMLNLLAALTFTFILPGFTYLFLLTAFLSIMALGIQMTLKHKAKKAVILAVPPVLITLYVPIIYTLYYAMTIGGLFVFALILALCFSLLSPLVCLASLDI